MQRFTYLVLSRPKGDRVAAFHDWVRDHHMPDVAKIPGVVSARLIEPQVQFATGIEAPGYTLATIYEIEGETAQGALDAILAHGGTEAMPLSDLLDLGNMMQLVGPQIAAIG